MTVPPKDHDYQNNVAASITHLSVELCKSVVE